MLRRLRFVFIGSVQKGYERYVYEKTVFAANFKRHLPHGLYKRLRFDIADSAADFCYYNVSVRLPADAVNEVFYLVCNVRYYLDGGAEVFAPALLVEHVPVNLTRGEV